MRNLKRALSLAVASVMLLGMMVVGTGAASYGDVDAQDNLEAIEVLQAVGIMTGDDQGNFNPDQLVTRGEMAVIMCKLLNLTPGGSHPFTDVPDWANGYVAAISANGVTGGTSATTYGTDDPLTAVQAALMIMKPLGYFGYQGEFGESWELATIKQANEIDLYHGLSVYTNQALTRNDVAQMVLNALECDVMIVREEGGMAVDGNGISVSVKPTYDKKKAENNSGKHYVVGATDDKVMQLCEKLYGNDLKKTTTGVNDDFGRPATQWDYKGTTIVSPEAATLTYTEAVKGKTIRSDLGKGNFDWAASDNTNTTGEYFYYEDGIKATSDTNLDISTSESGEFGSQGALTEVYYDAETKDVTIVVTNTYLAEVSKDYDAKNETLTIAYEDASGLPATVSADDVAGLDAFQAEDMVLVTIASTDGTTSNDYVASVTPAEKITGVVTGYTVNESVTLGGVTYKYNAGYVDTGATGENGTYVIDNSYDAYLDTYGNIIKAEGVSAEASQYVFIKEIKSPSGLSVGGNANAAAYFTDGSYDVITVSKVDGNAPDTTNTQTDSNKWYTFTEKDGKYELTAVSMATGSGVNEANEVVTSNGDIDINLSGSSTTKGTSATIFVVRENDNDVKAYTGVKNVPTITAAATSDTSIYVVNNANGYAKYVFIELGSAVVTDTASSSSDLIYIIDASDETKSVDADGNTYYTYDAIVNGEVTTINTSSGTVLDAVGLYTDVEYDDDGYVESAVLLTTTNTAAGATYEDKFMVIGSFDNATVTQNNGVISIGTNNLLLADGAKIYTIAAADDEVKTTSAKALVNEYGTGMSAQIFGVLTDGEYTALYIDLGL